MREVIQIKAVIMVLFLAIIISYVNATQVRTIQVSPLTKEMLIFNLDEGDRFSGSLSISGGAGNDIDFWVTDPYGNTIINLGRVSQGSTFEFTAHKSGAYTFHFDNTFSLLSSKTVSLSFDISVTSPVNPLMFVAIGIIIIGIAIIGLIVLSHHRKIQTTSKTNQKTLQ